MKHDLPRLPIHDVLPELLNNLSQYRSVVLSAEPGSGKTTIAPFALLDEPWLSGKKIIVLEPRRLAARMAAKRMSEIFGDSIGGLVGYRIRFDSKISSRTRIEVVTEGIFTRMIQKDPELTGIGLVIFDEFHVRSMQADLALALCLDVFALHDTLRLLIMSATMDTSRVSKMLGGAPVVVGKGRSYPVEVKYLSRLSDESIINQTVRKIHSVLNDHDGDILVFLPGAGEIKAVQRMARGEFICLPLYGNLPQKQQDLVFAQTDLRRLILATPIAETSLTIEGVSIVIDSGLMKVPRFSPSSGLTTLHTICISKDSANQRAGRAGRVGPGVCYRLWTESEHHSKADFLQPEIIGADLAPLLLEVLNWGVKDPSELTWMDPPREGQVNQAQELLVQLGGIDGNNTLTDVGRELIQLPLHPRLALMLLRGREQGNGTLSCRLAALVQNRDLFRGSDQQRSIDIEDRLEILHQFERSGSSVVRNRGADPSLCRKVLQEAKQYERILNISETVMNYHESANLLALAYPDRIAQKKVGSSQHILSSGRGVIVPKGDHLMKEDFLVAAHVDGGKKQGRVFLGAALSLDEIISEHSHLLSRKDKVVWNKNKVEALTVLSLGRLEISKQPLTDIDPGKIQHCLLEGIKQSGLESLGWNKKSRELQARMQCACLWDPEKWIEVSDSKLTQDFSWLAPYLGSSTTLKQLKKIDLYQVLSSLLSWKAQQELDRLLPSHLLVPSGSKIKLVYQPGDLPFLAVRLQELFGCRQNPSVFNGEIPVVVHLLSPAGRAMQVTRDLAGFWKTTYHDVKKELKGRYPKHFWPDDPMTAQPTNRVKRKS